MASVFSAKHVSIFNFSQDLEGRGSFLMDLPTWPESQGEDGPRACLNLGFTKFSNIIPVLSPQVYWLHMVYAAVGAICFTLVRPCPTLGRGVGSMGLDGC